MMLILKAGRLLFWKTSDCRLGRADFPAPYPNLPRPAPAAPRSPSPPRIGALPLFVLILSNYTEDVHCIPREISLGDFPVCSLMSVMLEDMILRLCWGWKAFICLAILLSGGAGATLVKGQWMSLGFLLKMISKRSVSRLQCCEICNIYFVYCSGGYVRSNGINSLCLALFLPRI